MRIIQEHESLVMVKTGKDGRELPVVQSVL